MVRCTSDGATGSCTVALPRMLVLVLLAAIAGRARAELRCSTVSGNDYFYLLDSQNCRVDEINAAFNGRLDKCSGGYVSRTCSQRR